MVWCGLAAATLFTYLHVRRSAVKRPVDACPVCDYDLVESADRCPECGTPIAAPTSTMVAARLRALTEPVSPKRGN
jgi:hypothetical protein